MPRQRSNDTYTNLSAMDFLVVFKFFSVVTKIFWKGKCAETRSRCDVVSQRSLRSCVGEVGKSENYRQIENSLAQSH